MVKAILKQLGLNEIEIDNYNSEVVKQFEIYVEDSILKKAKRIKLIDKNNIVKIDEF